MLVGERVMPDFPIPEHEMFTGRRPRAFQFKCCVDAIILGQAIVLRKVKENRSYRTYRTYFSRDLSGFGFDDAVGHVG